ncbi:MAG: hypothetical protein ACWA5U_07040 [bacterium]
MMDTPASATMQDSTKNTQSTSHTTHYQTSDLAFLEIFKQRANEAVKADEDMDYKAQKSMQHAEWIRHIAFAIALLLTPIIFYLIMALVLDMGKITERMGSMQSDIATMNNDFSKVSSLMNEMDQSIMQMNNHVKVIPPMGQNVKGMETEFGQMVTAMQTIQPNVHQINGFLSIMYQDMSQMNQQFSYLNYNVYQMQDDVDTMSAPMRLIPSFF